MAGIRRAAGLVGLLLGLGLGLGGPAVAAARPLDEPHPAPPPGGSARGAAALPQEALLPEGLLLEVVSAPGYVWMEACLQAGGAGGPAAGSVAPPVSGPATDDGGHAAHHPARAAGAPPLGAAEAGRARAALQEMFDTLDRLRAGLEEAGGPRQAATP